MKLIDADGNAVFRDDKQCSPHEAQHGYAWFLRLKVQLGRTPTDKEVQDKLSHRLSEHMYEHYKSLAERKHHYVPMSPWENGGRDLVDGVPAEVILKRLLRRAGMVID